MPRLRRRSLLARSITRQREPNRSEAISATIQEVASPSIGLLARTNKKISGEVTRPLYSGQRRVYFFNDSEATELFLPSSSANAARA